MKDDTREGFLRQRYNILSDSDEFLFFNFPSPTVPIIIQEDYKNGTIERFFVKKINDRPITEIDVNQYNRFISDDFHKAISLTWKISGPRNNVVSRNRVDIIGVEDFNMKQVLDAEEKMKGIKIKLSNLLLYWRGF